MSKQKLQKLQSSLNEEEAELLFHLLLKSLETANHQKVQYQSEDLKDESSLMVNVELNTRNVPAAVIEKLLGLLK